MKKIGMILFPRVTAQDFVGPYEVFSKFPYFSVLMISQTAGVLVAEGGLKVHVDYSFQDIDKVDILFIPGGPGINQVIQDEEYIQYIQKLARTAEYITSVCTGSLVLAAAGLLNGYKATCHWRYLPLLKDLGIETVEERVVVDRNRVTGGGVTAGIDFALTLTAVLTNPEVAKRIELQLEYNPQPPFKVGHPSLADENTLKAIVEKTERTFQERKRILQAIQQHT